MEVLLQPGARKCKQSNKGQLAPSYSGHAGSLSSLNDIIPIWRRLPNFPKRSPGPRSPYVTPHEPRGHIATIKLSSTDKDVRAQPLDGVLGPPWAPSCPSRSHHHLIIMIVTRVYDQASVKIDATGLWRSGRR